MAQDEPQLRGIVAKILSNRRRSLGTVIVRRYMELRATRIGPGGLPLGREYRVFLYRDQALGLGYYWEGANDAATLTPPEREKVTRLATEASRRLRVPYLAVDVGQLANGEWKVIEVGDAQFSGLCQVSIHALWAALQRLEPGPGAVGPSGTGG